MSAEYEILSDIVLAVSAIGAGLFGYWRCRTADRNLRHQQHLTGSELLSSQHDNCGQRYTNRVIGTVTLAKLMEEDPKQYDDKVVRVFERFLSGPPVFSVDIEGHKKNATDFESWDTVEAIRALNRRPRKRKEMNPPRLWPNGGPLMVENGNVVPNTSHEDYQSWLTVKGRKPDY